MTPQETNEILKAYLANVPKEQISEVASMSIDALNNFIEDHEDQLKKMQDFNVKMIQNVKEEN